MSIAATCLLAIWQSSLRRHDFYSGLAFNVEYSSSGGLLSLSFMGKSASRFMSGLGYDLLPTQQLIYSYEGKGYYSLPGRNPRGFTITTGKEIRITEKVGYFKKGHKESAKNRISGKQGASNIISYSEYVGIKLVTQTIFLERL